MDLNLKLKYLPSKGFHLVLSKVAGMKIPEAFFVQTENTAAFVLVTLELLKFNERVRESLEEIFLLSDKYFEY